MMAGETAPWRGGKVNSLHGPLRSSGSAWEIRKQTITSVSFPLPPFSFQFQLARCVFFRGLRPQRDVEISLQPKSQKGNLIFCYPLIWKFTASYGSSTSSLPLGCTVRKKYSHDFLHSII